jgi:hypothetical protein
VTKLILTEDSFQSISAARVTTIASSPMSSRVDNMWRKFSKERGSVKQNSGTVQTARPLRRYTNIRIIGAA